VLPLAVALLFIGTQRARMACGFGLDTVEHDVLGVDFTDDRVGVCLMEVATCAVEDALDAPFDDDFGTVTDYTELQAVENRAAVQLEELFFQLHMPSTEPPSRIIAVLPPHCEADVAASLAVVLAKFKGLVVDGSHGAGEGSVHNLGVCGAEHALVAGFIAASLSHIERVRQRRAMCVISVGKRAVVGVTFWITFPSSNECTCLIGETFVVEGYGQTAELTPALVQRLDSMVEGLATTIRQHGIRGVPMGLFGPDYLLRRHLRSAVASCTCFALMPTEDNAAINEGIAPYMVGAAILAVGQTHHTRSMAMHVRVIPSLLPKFAELLDELNAEGEGVESFVRGDSRVSLSQRLSQRIMGGSFSSAVLPSSGSFGTAPPLPAYDESREANQNYILMQDTPRITPRHSPRIPPKSGGSLSQ
jgi:hypothetical protein